MGNSLYLTKNLKVFLRRERRVDKNLFDIDNAMVVKCTYGVTNALTFGERNGGSGSQRKKALVALPAPWKAILFGLQGLCFIPHSIFRIHIIFYYVTSRNDYG